VAVVTVELQEDVARFVQARAKQESAVEPQIVADLVRGGFEQNLKRLYRAYQEGEISLSSLAEQLGITTWRAYHLLEERGWRTANV